MSSFPLDNLPQLPSLDASSSRGEISTTAHVKDKTFQNHLQRPTESKGADDLDEAVATQRANEQVSSEERDSRGSPKTTDADEAQPKARRAAGAEADEAESEKTDKTIEFKQQLVSELDSANAGTNSFVQSTKPNAQSPGPEAKLQRDTVNDLDGIGTTRDSVRMSVDPILDSSSQQPKVAGEHEKHIVVTDKEKKSQLPHPQFQAGREASVDGEVQTTQSRKTPPSETANDKHGRPGRSVSGLRQPLVGEAVAVESNDANGNRQPSVGVEAESTSRSEAESPRPSANMVSDSVPQSSSRSLLHALSVTGMRSDRPEQSRQFDQARFVQRVARAFESAEQRGGPIRLRLSPPELGSLRLEVKVEGHVMLVRVEAETPAARTLLLDNLGVLRERLAQQDIRIEQFDIDLLDRESQSSADGQQQNASTGHQHQSGATTSKDNDVESDVPSVARPTDPFGQDGSINVIV